MNTLTLGFVPFEFDGHHTMIGEFFIDDKPLCEWFGLGRDLANCYSELDAGKLRLKNFICQLKGETKPVNQFGTPRLVLYRCHCGCDYCGVVSCEIIIQEHSVIWQNVGYENDEIGDSELDEFDQWRLMSFDFMFDKRQYLTEIKRFFDECQKYL